MESLYDTAAQRMSSAWRGHDVPKHSRSFRCQCGRHVFFRNSLCIACSTPLGYLPERSAVVSLSVGSAPGRWRVPEAQGGYKRCANLDTPAGCNWLLPADEAASHCISCRLDRTIPDVGDAYNRLYWSAIEAAERRLVSQLLSLGLPVKSKLGEDTARGLMFDFLRSPPSGPRVMTGLASGLITLNVEEADDVKREKIRHDLREPYRTLLGHFHHEVGAETWAHYLHVVDGLGAALGFGLEADDLETDAEPFTRADLYAPDDPDADRFLYLLNG